MNLRTFIKSLPVIVVSPLVLAPKPTYRLLVIMLDKNNQAAELTADWVPIYTTDVYPRTIKGACDLFGELIKNKKEEYYAAEICVERGT